MAGPVQAAQWMKFSLEKIPLRRGEHHSWGRNSRRQRVTLKNWRLREKRQLMN
jgi:hypothetical protein